MQVLNLVEPFWGAWKIYGWEKPIPGIGIKKEIIMEAIAKKESIRVIIGKDKTVYEISPTTILNVVKKYNSVKTVRFGVKVAVVPQNKFSKIYHAG